MRVRTVADGEAGERDAERGARGQRRIPGVDRRAERGQIVPCRDAQQS